MSDTKRIRRLASRGGLPDIWRDEVIGLCDELDRLQAILDTICYGAKSEMWVCGGGVVCNVNLWTLPRCDGRNGTLLESAEKSRVET